MIAGSFQLIFDFVCRYVFPCTIFLHLYCLQNRYPNIRKTHFLFLKLIFSIYIHWFFELADDLFKLFLLRFPATAKILL